MRGLSVNRNRATGERNRQPHEVDVFARTVTRKLGAVNLGFPKQTGAARIFIFLNRIASGLV